MNCFRYGTGTASLPTSVRVPVPVPPPCLVHVTLPPPVVLVFVIFGVPNLGHPSQFSDFLPIYYITQDLKTAQNQNNV